MKTKLVEIAKKAQQEPNIRFISLAHHITRELIWESLDHIDKKSASGVDNISVEEAKNTFQIWIDPMIQSMHHKGYKPPMVKRCWIPKPGKEEKRPIGIPCVGDRALQRSVAIVLTQIYEQDFLPCSFGGRSNRSAHQALSTLNEIVTGKKINWVYEADLKNFFGSLNHDWLVKFVEHRIGDPRIISLIRRWLRTGIFEKDKITLPELGVPQGGSISVLLSNIYLHYVLDLWFEKIVKPRLQGESYLIRYIDDFIVCFQYKEDAIKFQNAMARRLAKFSLILEPNKTRLVEFGRFAKANISKRGNKVETIYFLGFTHYCSTNKNGNFKLGRKTEKTRFRNGLHKIKILIKNAMHFPIKIQRRIINQFLRGHYNYYGLGDNFHSLHQIYYYTIRIWKITLSRRSQKGRITWKRFNRIKELNTILKPRLQQFPKVFNSNVFIYF
jgi:RNA-directed DNA polymerase